MSAGFKFSYPKLHPSIWLRRIRIPHTICRDVQIMTSPFNNISSPIQGIFETEFNYIKVFGQLCTIITQASEYFASKEPEIKNGTAGSQSGSVL